MHLEWSILEIRFGITNKKEIRLSLNYVLYQGCPTFFDPRSTFQVANLPRSTSLVSTLQTYLQGGALEGPSRELEGVTYLHTSIQIQRHGGREFILLKLHHVCRKGQRDKLTISNNTLPASRDGSEYSIIRSRGSKSIFNIWKKFTIQINKNFEL